MTRQSLLRGNRPLALLFGLVVLANVPFLSPSLVFVHDTQSKLHSFHYVYSQLFFDGEIPRWVPTIYYGLTADLFLFAMQPVDWVMMALGWLLGVRDALVLFKI